MISISMALACSTNATPGYPLVTPSSHSRSSTSPRNRFRGRPLRSLTVKEPIVPIYCMDTLWPALINFLDYVWIHDTQSPTTHLPPFLQHVPRPRRKRFLSQQRHPPSPPPPKKNNLKITTKTQGKNNVKKKARTTEKK